MEITEQMLDDYINLLEEEDFLDKRHQEYLAEAIRIKNEQDMIPKDEDIKIPFLQ